MKKIVLEGAFTALVTPFKKNGDIDKEAFKKFIRFQLNEGISGVVVCGSTGEAATLTDEEFVEAVRIVVKEVNGRVPVIAGAGSNSTVKAIMLSKLAQKEGVDGLLHVTPYYNKPTPSGLVAHFKAIAGAVDLPIILYNVPGRTGSNVLPATILQIVKQVPSIVAIKEASGNIEQIGELVQKAPAGFSVLSGDDALTLPAMALGATGCISVVSNEVPKAFTQLCTSALQGNWKKAREIHFKLLDLMKMNFIESNPIPVKKALSFMGLIQEYYRLPLVPLEEKNVPIIESCLKKLQLL